MVLGRPRGQCLGSDHGEAALRLGIQVVGGAGAYVGAAGIGEPVAEDPVADAGRACAGNGGWRDEVLAEHHHRDDVQDRGPVTPPPPGYGARWIPCTVTLMEDEDYRARNRDPCVRSAEQCLRAGRRGNQPAYGYPCCSRAGLVPLAALPDYAGPGCRRRAVRGPEPT